MRQCFLSILLITAFFFSCKKGNNSDGSSPNPVTPTYRISKLMFDPPTSDSIVFSYLNNQLCIITHYFYSDGGQINEKYYYYYNSNNTVNKIICQNSRTNESDTTYYAYQSTLLNKIYFRYKHDDYSNQSSYNTKISADVSNSNNLISQLHCSYYYHYSIYTPPIIFQDSLQFTSMVSYTYSGNNISQQQYSNQFGYNGSASYEYDTKVNPIKLCGAMPTLSSFPANPNLMNDSTLCISLNSLPLSQYLNDFCCLCSNNITKETHTNYTLTYQYEYNSVGLPTKALISNKKASSMLLFVYEQIK